jgi:hypothetical protein
MNANVVKSKFRSLVEAASKRWDATSGADELEPALLDILNFVKAHIESRSVLEDAFIELSRSKGVPVEILEFCMHELRWSKVRDEVESAIRGSTDLREQQALERVLTAYSDDWEDADLYAYYHGRKG